MRELGGGGGGGCPVLEHLCSYWLVNKGPTITSSDSSPMHYIIDNIYAILIQLCNMNSISIYIYKFLKSYFYYWSVHCINLSSVFFLHNSFILQMGVSKKFSFFASPLWLFIYTCSSSYFFGTYVFVFYIYFWINWFTEVTCNCIGYITLLVQYFSLNFLVIYCLFRKKIVLHKVPINLSIVHVHSLFAQKLPWCAVSS